MDATMAASEIIMIDEATAADAREMGNEPIFNRDHHLQLLQLQARKAMADRLNRRGGVDAEDEETAPAEIQPEAVPLVPDRWRLVPEGLQLYAWQQECLPLWLQEGRGTVKVATGGGKTLFALAAAQALQNGREPDLRLVIVVPTIPLMFQWREELRQGNLPDAAIGMMGGGQDLPPLAGLRVLICVLNSARERLPTLARRADWPRRMLLVVDECHRSGAARASRIFETQPRYTLGLSATPEQDLDAGEVPRDEAYNQSIVGSALGPIIFEFALRESLDAGLLTPFEVWHLGLSLESDEAAQHASLSRDISDLRRTLQVRHRRSRSRQGFLAWCQTQVSRRGPVAGDAERFIGLANRRKRLLYRARSRTATVLDILSESRTDPESQAIVFHESIEEIERLFLQATGRGIPAVLEHSRLPDGLRSDSIEAFRTGVARVIISARSLVEGFNVPSADLGIIAASSSSVRQRIQSLGRMLRRKPGGRAARVIVLYVRNTEDEAIYEKADWENVIGAERNRYFTMQPPLDGGKWIDHIAEAPAAPRQYRPPCWEVDANGLSAGDPYPGRPDGRIVHLDQDDNLRDEDGSLLSAPGDLAALVAVHSTQRRAVLTPCGHLIVDSQSGQSGEQGWRFLGLVNPTAEANAATVIRLKLKRASGRRVIARDDARRSGVVPFALGPSRSRAPEAGEARDQLLAWIRREEGRLGRTLQHLYWDGGSEYWLEVSGERLPFGTPLAPLEFER